MIDDRDENGIIQAMNFARSAAKNQPKKQTLRLRELEQENAALRTHNKQIHNLIYRLKNIYFLVKNYRTKLGLE